ncbi:hypothetical protein H6P81_009318 [Aristolochia fimbriata]|uniref:Uncharacterized protein n=1 Tax=Aristolochia fimbriata TaxID=158543 RepID=A0AAV7EKQ4_ARIFI|nr:hypothetical protein H6P81_009318 [Aristolochia fimbriata]
MEKAQGGKKQGTEDDTFEPARLSGLPLHNYSLKIKDCFAGTPVQVARIMGSERPEEKSKSRTDANYLNDSERVRQPVEWLSSRRRQVFGQDQKSKVFVLHQPARGAFTIEKLTLAYKQTPDVRQKNRNLIQAEDDKTTLGDEITPNSETQSCPAVASKDTRPYIDRSLSSPLLTSRTSSIEVGHRGRARGLIRRPGTGTDHENQRMIEKETDDWDDNSISPPMSQAEMNPGRNSKFCIHACRTRSRIDLGDRTKQRDQLARDGLERDEPPGGLLPHLRLVLPDDAIIGSLNGEPVPAGIGDVGLCGHDAPVDEEGLRLPVMFADRERREVLNVGGAGLDRHPLAGQHSPAACLRLRGGKQGQKHEKKNLICPHCRFAESQTGKRSVRVMRRMGAREGDL